jgi:hypothetical protein
MEFRPDFPAGPTAVLVLARVSRLVSLPAEVWSKPLDADCLRSRRDISAVFGPHFWNAAEREGFAYPWAPFTYFR